MLKVSCRSTLNCHCQSMDKCKRNSIIKLIRTRTSNDGPTNQPTKRLPACEHKNQITSWFTALERARKCMGISIKILTVHAKHFVEN
ncbi:hypothetical protein DPMN_181442 [Dreissena polymorpha]|uniref:Uncharacterized protein n=1 Tax=Dreissena polymorpha TaxID=45954 RepID=A0A9D4DDT7_DREPO|nr:hypothetical protein DPMN_181442 [Dreissena polymorpha]